MLVPIISDLEFSHENIKRTFFAMPLAMPLDPFDTLDSHAKGKPQFHERLYQRPFCFLNTQLISKMIQNGGKTAPAKSYWHIKNTTIGCPKIEQTFLVWWPNDSPFSKSARHSKIISHAALLSFKVHLGRKHRFAHRKWRGSSKHFRSTRSNS